MGEGKKQSTIFLPSLISKCGAELDDLSLLDGKELAAKELVACSCIFLTFGDRSGEREGKIVVLVAKLEKRIKRKRAGLGIYRRTWRESNCETFWAGIDWCGYRRQI